MFPSFPPDSLFWLLKSVSFNFFTYDRVQFHARHKTKPTTSSSISWSYLSRLPNEGVFEMYTEQVNNVRAEFLTIQCYISILTDIK